MSTDTTPEPADAPETPDLARLTRAEASYAKRFPWREGHENKEWVSGHEAGQREAEDVDRGGNYRVEVDQAVVPEYLCQAVELYPSLPRTAETDDLYRNFTAREQATWIIQQLADQQRASAEEIARLTALVESRTATATRLEAELARLREVLPVCQECGPILTIDEDGCCATCGADTLLDDAQERTETVTADTSTPAPV